MDNPFLFFGACTPEQLAAFKPVTVTIRQQVTEQGEPAGFGVTHCVMVTDKLTGQKHLVNEVIGRGETPGDALMDVLT